MSLSAPLIKSSVFATVLAGILFAGIFGLISLFSFTQGPYPISAFDAWYHSTAEYELSQGTPAKDPILHPNREAYGTVHHGYQLIGSWFFDSTESLDPLARLWRHKTYNSVILMVLMTILGVIAFWELRNVLRSNGLRFFLVTGIILLFFFGTGVSVRHFMERPHNLFLIFVTLTIFTTIKKKYLWNILWAALAAWSYSLSGLLLIPPMIFWLSSLVFNRFGASTNITRGWQAPVFSLLGLIIGISMLHPDPQFIFYNGNVLLVKQIITDFLGITPQIREFSNVLSGPFVFENSSVWLGLIILSITVWVSSFQKDSLKKSLQSLTPTTSAVVIIFIIYFVGSFFIVRFIEYFIPLSLLVMTFVWKEAGPWLQQEIKPALLSKKHLTLVGASICVLLAGYLYYGPISDISKNSWLLQQGNYYYGPSFDTTLQVLKDQASPHDIVLANTFSLFPYMYAYNQDIDYLTGISEIYGYDADLERYWLSLNLTRGSRYLCDTIVCDKSNDMPISEALEQLDVDFILIDWRHWHESIFSLHRLEDSPLVEKIAQNNSVYLYQVQELQD
jgi:hypothetical protein